MKPAHADATTTGEVLPLQDRTPTWFRTCRTATVVTALLSLLFVFLSFQPLWHTDVWGHLAYGRWIWTAKALPATEPLMPLSQGLPFTDTAWLSQLIGYAFMSKWGTAGIKFLYAAPITLCCSLLALRLFRRTENGWFSMAGVLAFLWISWQQFLVVRPQLGGVACFVTLLFLLTRRTWPRAGWWIIPTLFALWANLHGSFVVGLITLATFGVGRAVDVVRRSNEIANVFRDPAVRRYFLLTELAFVATLVNPYGLGLYPAVVAISQNANLESLFEWEPLSLRMRQGQAAAVVAMALAIVYRLSPRRVQSVEVLLLGGLGALSLWTSRMIVWWAPVAAYYFALHANAAWNVAIGGRLHLEPIKRTSLSTVASIGIAWIAFAMAPFGAGLIHGARPEVTRNFSSLTPLGAVDYLKKNPPQGLVFNGYEIGDYLLLEGPPGTQIFVSTHAHLIPEEVWQHYRQVSQIASGWEEVLDQYGINTVVLDTADNASLIRVLKRNEAWRLGYEDNTAAVLYRRNPL